MTQFPDGVMRMTIHDLEPIELSVIGSNQTTVRAMPAALEPGGVQIETVTFPGTLIEKRGTLSLSAAEAEVLAEQIATVLRAGRPDTTPARGRRPDGVTGRP